MRKTVTFGVATLIAIGMPAAAFAAGAATASRQAQPPGTIRGAARSAKGENLVQTKIRVRNASTGAIAAELTTDGAGGFVGVVPAGNYIVEVVGMNGAVIGLSPTITVAAGTTATVGVTATSLAAVTGAGGAAAGGGLSLFGLGTAASVAVLTTAGVLTTVGIVAATHNASGSK